MKGCPRYAKAMVFTMQKFYGKMKAVTFSYDDGVTQDQRLISLFNKYNLKCRTYPDPSVP